MKTEEIRHMSDEELGSELGRLRRHLFDLRAQAVTEKLEDTTMVRKTKRDIARILTFAEMRESDAGGRDA